MKKDVFAAMLLYWFIVMKPLQDSKFALTLLGVLAYLCFFASFSNSADAYSGVVVEAAGE